MNKQRTPDGVLKMKIESVVTWDVWEETETILWGWTIRRWLTKSEYDTPEKLANHIVDNFNKTLRPGESPRKLLSVEYIKGNPKCDT